MRRMLEGLFRHPAQALTLFLTPILLSMAVLLVIPGSYKATASLWALRPFTVIGATGPEADRLATPAESQATAIDEMVQTRSFALAVAHSTHLASELSNSTRANPQLADEALYHAISAGIFVSAQGYNLVTISYTDSDQHIAEEVVAAVIAHYGEQGPALAVNKGQQLIADDTSRLPQLQATADAAIQAASSYLANHPQDHDPQVAMADMQYQLLRAQAQEAQAQVTSLQSTIDVSSQNVASLSTGAAGLFYEMDRPLAPSRPTWNVRGLLLGAFGGAVLGLLATLAYIFLLEMGDRALYQSDEIERSTDWSVLSQLPYLRPASIGHAISLASKRPLETDR
ncbi:MAG TPA: hypothetical protein VF792_05405 [Ktedonobacterales bacterium]